jgi:hypothetical protein
VDLVVPGQRQPFICKTGFSGGLTDEYIYSLRRNSIPQVHFGKEDTQGYEGTVKIVNFCQGTNSLIEVEESTSQPPKPPTAHPKNSIFNYTFIIITNLITY